VLSALLNDKENKGVVKESPTERYRGFISSKMKLINQYINESTKINAFFSN